MKTKKKFKAFDWKESKKGIYECTDYGRFNFLIVNCHINPRHACAHNGTNFYLSIGKLHYSPIGDFYSLEDAKQAAKNVAIFYVYYAE